MHVQVRSLGRALDMLDGIHRCYAIPDGGEPAQHLFSMAISVGLGRGEFKLDVAHKPAAHQFPRPIQHLVLKTLDINFDKVHILIHQVI
jgi:hypothetical protein